MGPIPFFLTFRAELKKISKKIIRPKMTDSRGNFKKRRGSSAAAAAQQQWKKNRLFCFWRYLNGTNSILPNFSCWVEKVYFFWDSAKNDGFQGKFYYYVVLRTTYEKRSFAPLRSALLRKAKAVVRSYHPWDYAWTPLRQNPVLSWQHTIGRLFLVGGTIVSSANSTHSGILGLCFIKACHFPYTHSGRADVLNRL